MPKDSRRDKGNTMKQQRLSLYAVALAVLIVGLAFAGVPTGTLLVVPFVLACPLMMVFMMRGMGHSTSSDRDDREPLLHSGDGGQSPARPVGQSEDTQHNRDFA